jgi:hypothetical protein
MSHAVSIAQAKILVIEAAADSVYRCIIKACEQLLSVLSLILFLPWYNSNVTIFWIEASGL